MGKSKVSLYYGLKKLRTHRGQGTGILANGTAASHEGHRKMMHPRARMMMATLLAVKVSPTPEKSFMVDTIMEPKVISKMPHI